VAALKESVRRSLIYRLKEHAAKKWKKECREVLVKFRGPHAYIDALPVRVEGRTEEEQESLRATPVHLCRLTYLSRSDVWGFAFYKYSDSKYERSYLPSGSMIGSPEACFDCAAGVYLADQWNPFNH
jgi:hypothetical protein